jgi:hypothetical protein
LFFLKISFCSFLIKADDAVREKYQEITGEKIPQDKKRKKSDIRKPILPDDLWYRKEPFS